MKTRRAFLQAAAGTFATAAALQTRAFAQEAGPSFSEFAPGLNLVPAGAGVQSQDVSLSVQDSPLTQALDIYYDDLIKLCKQNGYADKDKMLMNNTITSFDIAADTPFYNEEIYRAFADRVFKTSPDDLGTTFRADRFSKHYQQLIFVAASHIDQQYEKIVPRVTELQQKLDDQTTKLTEKIATINGQWADLAKKLGLTQDTNDYELRYVNYLEQIRYADQIDQYSKNIDMIDGSIDAVRRSAYSATEQVILDNLAELSSTKMISRPVRPNFERTTKDVTELMFANPSYRSGMFDVSPYTLPLGDLTAFLKNSGPRDIAISKEHREVQQHDKSWSGGGGGSFSFFGIGVGGSAGGSGSSSYVKQMKATNGIAIHFDNIAEVLVDRTGWFNPAIFEDEKLRKVFERIPGYDKLQYVSVSLIIARGLTLTLTFDSQVDETQWSKQAFSASGGVSFMGYRFGGSGASSRYDYNMTVDGDKKSVTFKDDPQLTRLLAVRVEPLVAPPTGVASVDDSLALFKNGTINYLDFQKRRIAR